ncbi:MAG TPA: outer membrane lipoprotein carrier protein LolA [Candidatus Angelobacter sp.]|nr:outer membrane lipoprotein carrier protein LolA [Candidatus Angelobacter sp.]
MKLRTTAAALFLLFSAILAHAQNLESTLDAMDKAATGFKTAQTEFVWDNYTLAPDDHELQKGVMYVRRQGDDLQMAADIQSPRPQDRKYLLFTGGVVSVYLPNAAQVTEYNAGKNKADFETFLVLGFGGRGHDLAKSFDVKYAGTEQVQGINAAKLVLTPKSSRVGNMFNKITLWIDPVRGVSVQQLFNAPSGDYRLAKYNNIKLNDKLSNDVFKLKTSGKVTYVRPNGQ